ncbi:Maf-like protein [Methylobacterium oryzihabitans]|uniref:dTTP/UTP pyrophosphatase n=1 Tax=Methylobacterium oryzihabitans TaxID=2499852 RepID=A0A3S2YTV1_9HYPH|nr:Maf-like protein [Methylobacterium oryzihabitans]RVU19080.1 Maf-like protein [Methylobacterium oryzihabitans]
MTDDSSSLTADARPKLVLASGSPRRLALLQQAGLEPDALLPADLDETPLKSEAPRELVRRLSRAKLDAALATTRHGGDLANAYFVAADTVVAVGRRILPKAEVADEAADCMRLLSGRTHRVYTAVCIAGPKERRRERLVETRVRFKRLSAKEIDGYVASGEWRGKAGGYAIQGLAGSFVVKLVGSYSAVVGLPLYETIALLDGEGYPVRAAWRDAA